MGFEDFENDEVMDGGFESDAVDIENGAQAQKVIKAPRRSRRDRSDDGFGQRPRRDRFGRRDTSDDSAIDGDDMIAPDRPVRLSNADRRERTASPKRKVVKSSSEFAYLFDDSAPAERPATSSDKASRLAALAYDEKVDGDKYDDLFQSQTGTSIISPEKEERPRPSRKSRFSGRRSRAAAQPEPDAAEEQPIPDTADDTSVQPEDDGALSQPQDTPESDMPELGMMPPFPPAPPYPPQPGMPFGMPMPRPPVYGQPYPQYGQPYPPQYPQQQFPQQQYPQYPQYGQPYPYQPIQVMPVGFIYQPGYSPTMPVAPRRRVSPHRDAVRKYVRLNYDDMTTQPAPQPTAVEDEPQAQAQYIPEPDYEPDAEPERAESASRFKPRRERSQEQFAAEPQPVFEPESEPEPEYEPERSEEFAGDSFSSGDKAPEEFTPEESPAEPRFKRRSRRGDATQEQPEEVSAPRQDSFAEQEQPAPQEQSAPRPKFNRRSR